MHDLKHTYGRRLRAAGVSFEDRQDLLGHKSSGSLPIIRHRNSSNLMHAAESICIKDRSKLGTMVILRKQLSHLKVA